MKRGGKTVRCVKASSVELKNWGFPKHRAGLPIRTPSRSKAK